MSDFLVGGIGNVTFVQGDAGDFFRPLHGGQFSTADGTESPDRETLLDTAFHVNDIRVNVSANTEDANHFLRIRKNQEAGFHEALIPANTTGEFSDTTGTTFASGDDISFNLNLIGDLGHDDAITIAWWVAGCDYTGDSTWVGAGGAAFPQGVARHFPIHGGNTANVNRAGHEWRPAVATTVDKVNVVVPQNNTDANSTVKLLANGSIGSIVVTITSGQTGLISDTTNSDSISAEDDLVWQAIIGAGMGGDTLEVFSTSARSSVDAYATIASYNGTSGSATATRFHACLPHNVLGDGATEADFQVRAEVDETVDRGAIGVRSNSRTTTNTYTFRDSGVDTTIVLSVAGSTTGLIQDLTHSHAVSAGDDINWKIVSGTGSGVLNWSYLSVDLPQFTAPPAPTGSPYYFRKMGQG